jgi:hypothetical protein
MNRLRKDQRVAVVQKTLSGRAYSIRSTVRLTGRSQEQTVSSSW